MTPGAPSFSMVTRPVIEPVASCEAAGDRPAHIPGAAPSNMATPTAMSVNVRTRVLLFPNKFDLCYLDMPPGGGKS
jgi:hypothetical protein